MKPYEWKEYGCQFAVNLIRDRKWTHRIASVVRILVAESVKAVNFTEKCMDIAR